MTRVSSQPPESLAISGDVRPGGGSAPDPHPRLDLLPSPVASNGNGTGNGAVPPHQNGTGASEAAPSQGYLGARAVPVSLYRWLDNTVVFSMLGVALVLRNVGRMPQGLSEFLAIRLSVKNLLLLAGLALAWRGITGLCGLYDPRALRSWRGEMRRVLLACSLAGAVALSFPLTSASGAFDYLALVLFWSGATLLMLGLRRVLRVAARVRPRPARNVLIVGTGPRAVRARESLRDDPDYDYRVLGFVDSDPPASNGFPRERILARLEEFDATLMHSPVDEVIVALPMKSQYAQIQHIVEFCESIGVAVTLPADAFRSTRSAFRTRPSPTLVAVTLTDTPERPRLVVKRALDVIGATLALVVFAPIMLATAVMIKATSRGPVLFSQERYGYNRRVFRMYKFRTMVVDAENLQASLEHLNEAAGPLFKIRRDPRLTVIGAFLRRTSIDELPQLFNVLRGDMSLVGPRPMAIRDVHRFPEATLMRRFSVPAGMTGLWQVTGRSALDYSDWAACDLRYVEQWSLLSDVRILARTIPAVLRGTGAQ